MAASLSPAPSCESYNRLVSVLNKALTKSTSQLDLDSLIQQVYANDAAIFGDDQLHSVMESMLENLEETVQRDMQQYLQNTKVEHKLLVVERLVHNLQAQETARKQALQADKDRTVRALEQIKLPSGVKPMDLANYQQYQKLQQEKQRLLANMEAAETDIQTLEQTKADRQAQVSLQSTKIQTVDQEIKNVATFSSTMVQSGEVTKMTSGQ